MFNMLLNMSITGGIVILLWYLSCPLSRRYLNASWHYAVLKITMVFMVFPISIFASGFNNMVARLFIKPDLPYISEISEQIQVININAEKIASVNSALSDIFFPVIQYYPPSPQTEYVIEALDNIVDDINNINPNVPYLQIIWLIVAVILVIGGICKMQRFKKQIFNNSRSNVDRDTLELFLQCKKQLKVRGRITLQTSDYIKTPLAFGLIRPLVIFPETGMSADEKRLAFVHELTHIKNGDLWLKIFAYFIFAVHWFNPFAHLLCRKISVISEEYCDECVVKTMTKEERLLYGHLILKVVSDIAAPQSKFCSTLSTPTKNIKRRLSNMINLKKSGKNTVALSIIAALIISSFATVYAFTAHATSENVTTQANNLFTKTSVNKNDSTDNKGNIVYNSTVSDSSETVTTQIGSLLITTPKGQEPIQNKDDTITLPGGGTYINNSRGDKITVSPGVIIKRDGTVPNIQKDWIVISESLDGEIVIIENQAVYINGKSLGESMTEATAERNKKDADSDVGDYNWDDFFAQPSKDTNYPWTRYLSSDKRAHLFKDGTKIIMPTGYYVTDVYDGNENWYIIYNSTKCTVEFPNGIKVVNAPINTRADYKNDKLTITIGDSEVTVTKPDGTSSAVPAETVLDNEGNVVK